MRAILTNFGTFGDMYPFLALADELRRHGHEPLLALPAFFAPHAGRLGIPCIPLGALGADHQQIQNSVNAIMIERPHAIEEMRDLLTPLVPAMAEVFEQLRALCRDGDVLISSPNMLPSQTLHEITGIPYVTLNLWYSYADGLVPPVFQEAHRVLVNPLRARLGLPSTTNRRESDSQSDQLALYAMSRHICPPVMVWPEHYHMTGFFFLRADAWQPEPELTAFLEEGHPPIAITFGSMPHSDADGLTGLLVESIRRAGCRAVIQRGWSGLAEGQHYDGQIYAAGYASHSWLFPRVACVVHHGGAGTTAATLRAGAPSVFVPHTWDQPLWAAFVHECGAAGPALPYHELTAERLAQAIALTRRQPAYTEAARVLRDKVRREQGVQKARQLIEQLVRRVGMA